MHITIIATGGLDMKKGCIRIIMLAVVLLGLILPASALAGSLTDFVSKLSMEAKADPSGFKAKLRAQFPVPGGTLDLVLNNVADPADAYMMLKIGEVSGQPVERVLDVYKANQGRGWGYIAQQMGIKPGSAEFHALKGGPSGKSKGKKGKGRGKGRR
jgi:hypothetical protein